MVQANYGFDVEGGFLKLFEQGKPHSALITAKLQYMPEIYYY